MTRMTRIKMTNFQLSIISLSLLVFILIIGVRGEVCRRIDPSGGKDIFQCPRLFESPKKKFCCGQTPQEIHCCEWSSKRRDPSSVQFVFDNIVSIIISILVLIAGIVVCCCVCACCLLSRKHQQRGQVLSNSRGEGNTSVTGVNTSLPNSVSYQIQPNSYQMQNVTAPYPIDQPPPYSYNGEAHPPYNPSYPIK